MAFSMNFPVWSCFGINEPRFRVRAQRLDGNDLSVLSSDGASVSGSVSAIGEKALKKGPLLDGGNGDFKSTTEKKVVKEKVSEELGLLWDDGYGTNTVKDYIHAAMDMIKPDGGPPRWFCPVECGRPIKDSPLLLFLPGLDGVGMGLILHHKPLGKVFEVQCLHIPVHDRTPFEGDSIGGCLALAVAARNPSVDLVMILVNPGEFYELKLHC
ncbi:hypothetical protein V6N13_052215 [Hibiscus sabdariffa]